MYFPSMFKHRRVVFISNTYVNQEGECNVANIGPSLLTNTIHFLVSWSGKGYLDTMLLAVTSEFSTYESGSSIGVNFFDILNVERRIGFEPNCIME